MSAGESALAVLIGYLAGSVPFGWLLVRLRKGIDIRTVGSGNVGATNVGRVLGRRASFLVYALDAAKGFAATTLLPPLLHSDGGLAAALAGFGSVLGHCFSAFLRLRGGKGVATGSGVLLALDPIAFAAGAGVWLLLLLLFRTVSVASLGKALAYPLAVYARDPGAAFAEKRLPILATALGVALLVFARHRANLRRLVEGTEPRLGGAPGKGA